MRKYRLIFFIDSLGVGGAEKTLVNIINNLDQAVYSITIVSLLKINNYEDCLSTNTKVVYKFDIYNSNKMVSIKEKIRFKIFKYLIKYFPSMISFNQESDIEIAFLEGITTKIVAYSKNNGKKVAWIHTDLSKNTWFENSYINIKDEIKTYSYFDEIVCVSNDCKESVSVRYKTQFQNLNVINNPILIEQIRSEADESKINFDKITVCSVGKLITVKGYERLIRVHAKLVNEGLLHDLIIVGEGEDREKLNNLINVLLVSKSVKLIGYKRNSYPYIKNCDIFISSSYTEGFPLVLAEAMVLGRPIIATDSTGSKEILDNGKYGDLVENSEEGIYSGLKRLLTNSEVRDRYSFLTTERLPYFDCKGVIRDIEFLFNHLIIS